MNRRSQEETVYDMVLSDVASGRSLSAHMLKSWHQLLTQHQATVAGISVDGKRVEIPFRTKGMWKVNPNNPKRPDGMTHPYCPPEQVVSEIDGFLEQALELDGKRLPVHVEAAWLHYRFVQIHPFQDGNGRVSRLLMIWPYLKRGLPVPIITAQGKSDYIDALEEADKGELQAFANYIEQQALATLTSTLGIAKRAISGELVRKNGNGPITIGQKEIDEAAQGAAQER